MKEMMGRFHVKDAGLIQVVKGPPSSGRSGNGEASAAESDGPRESGRSMWRKFFGWFGARQVSPRPASGVVSEEQPELASVDDRNEVAPGKPVVESKKRFRLLPGRNPFGRPAKEPVQAEFRFENVRVVCNELHDTDFIIKT